MRGCGKRNARGGERRWGTREVLGRRRRERCDSKGEVRAKGGVRCGVWEWEHKAGGREKHNSTGGRVGLRAWDIWAEMGVSGRARGVRARERGGGA